MTRIKPLKFPSDHCVIIGEVAQAHDGSLGQAHAFIDAIADAGCDAVKFQTHIADAESSPGEPWRVKFSQQDETRFDYWKRMEFTEPQWLGLRNHATEQGLAFISSPFSSEAIELLIRVGVSAWKIASGEVSTPGFLERMQDTQLPVLLSTGMSPTEEIDLAVEKIRKASLPLVVMQCTSIYPTPASKLGLNVISEFRGKYDCPVGLSDHSGTTHAGIAAVTYGISALEVHVTLSEDAFGPDVPVSLTPDRLKTLVEGVRFIEDATASPVDKNDLARELAPMREIFNKSLFAKRKISAGSNIAESDIAIKKPGNGIPAARLNEFVGTTAKYEIAAGSLLKEEDFK
jgi:N,N'-diacetyllegionaminate synthase